MVLLFATILHIRALPGDIAGVVYATDIRTTLFGAPVTAFNIGGKTCIDAEILNWHYGFDVYWYGDTRRLEITDLGSGFVSLQAKAGTVTEHTDAPVGTVLGRYYETDIVTTLNGCEIESYNIGGRTVICAEAMADFGYDVVWDGAARTLSITKPADFYRYDTDFGIIRSGYESGVNREWRVFYLGDISVSGMDGKKQMLEIPSGRTYVLPSGVTYMKLADLASALGGTCEMTEENGRYIFRLDWDPETMPALRAYDPERDQGRREQTDTDEKDVYLPHAALMVNGDICPIRTMMAGKMRDTELLLIENHVYIPVDTVMWLLGCMPDYLRTKY